MAATVPLACGDTRPDSGRRQVGSGLRQRDEDSVSGCSVSEGYDKPAERTPTGVVLDTSS